MVGTTPSFTIVGAGGNGSIMLTHLCRIHQAWVALGGVPFGIKIMDDDRVSPANLARQCFSEIDVGYLKSAVLAQRARSFFGVNVTHSGSRLKSLSGWHYGGTCFITCTDTSKSRATFAKGFDKASGAYWLDLGNGADTGQVILGGHGLPHVVDVLPQIIKQKDDGSPSCSMAEALSKQDLFINSTLATFGAQIIWRLLRHGSITHHGYFINLSSGHVRPLAVPAL